MDESSERGAVAFASNPSREQREMDEAACFIPSAEAAGGHIVFDTLGGSAQESVFPIMDGTRAVGGQVADPAPGHHPFQNEGGTVAQEMRAVNQQDPGSIVLGLENIAGATFHRR